MVSIAEILTALCARVGLGPGDIDVSDLEEIYVQGYVISRVMTVADAIEPLRKAGFFDIIEDGSRIKFVTRGKAVVRTLTEDDIGAHDGTNDVPPAAVVTRSMQEVELPRLMRLHFRNEARDYDNDQALSPTRLTTRATNVTDLELPITITETQAAQIVEVLWSEAWVGRFIHQTAVDHTHVDLEPSDCIYLPVDGRLERCRILSIDDAQIVLRKLELVRDDDGSYVSTAIADSPERTVTSVVILAFDTALEFLDLPPLRTEDTDAGFYIAARRSGTRGNSWRGAIIFRSTDDGATFQEILSVSQEAVVGSVLTALPEGVLPVGSPTLFDDVNTLSVLVPEGTSLSSRSDAELGQGANTAAIGVNGRWEILQFGTATQVNATEWNLTHLLRGRRGSEHNLGTSVLGDRFVLLSEGGILRAPLTVAQLNQEYIYKAVSFGQNYTDGVDFEYSGTGETLEPFSPTDLEASQVGNDVQITWTRRDRLGQELVNFGTEPESDTPTTYEIDIVILGSPGGVIRTLTSSTESVLYTQAQRTADGIGTEFSAIVYQVSPTEEIGRGAGAQIDVDLSLAGSSSLTFAATGRAVRMRNARGSSSLTFTGAGELEGILGGGSGEFVFTAGTDGGSLAGYADAGWIDPGVGTEDSNGWGVVVRALYIDAFDPEDVYLTLVLTTNSTEDPGDAFLDAIQFTGDEGLTNLTAAAADPPDGTSEGNRRVWSWALGSNVAFSNGNQYTITLNP
jgi:hypothetical protein